MEAGRQEKLRRIASLAQEAQELIPRALEARARKNYEGIRQVEVYRYSSGISRIFSSGKKSRKMGAYLLSFKNVGEGARGPEGFAVFLGSDGHLIPGSELHTVAEFAEKVRQYEGLAPSKYGIISTRELYSIVMFSSVVVALRAMAGGK